MNKVLFLVLNCIIVIFLVSCFRCETCKNNLTPPYRLKIQYKDSDVIYFKNDTLGLRSDTVGVKIVNPKKELYGCTGGHDEDKYKCEGFMRIYLKRLDIGAYIRQSPNSENNKIYYKSISYEKYFDDEYNKSNTMYYNNTTYIVIKDRLDKPFFRDGHDSVDVIEVVFSVEPALMILQYSTYDTNGVERVWRLQ